MRATRALATARLHADGVAAAAPCRPTIVPAKPRKSGSARFDPLHGQPQRLLAGARLVDARRRREAHQRGALVPGRVRPSAERRCRRAPRRSGCRRRRGQPELGSRTSGTRPRSRAKAACRVVDQVHLVDGQDDVADAEQRDEEAVRGGSASEHALRASTRTTLEVGGRRSRHHVACVLFVPWAVGDDEISASGKERPVGDVEVGAGRARPGMVEQAVDQRALARALAAARVEAEPASFQVGERHWSWLSGRKQAPASAGSAPRSGAQGGPMDGERNAKERRC